MGTVLRIVVILQHVNSIISPLKFMAQAWRGMGGVLGGRKCFAFTCSKWFINERVRERKYKKTCSRVKLHMTQSPTYAIKNFRVKLHFTPSNYRLIYTHSYKL
jgi:hypothetical protein